MGNATNSVLITQCTLVKSCFGCLLTSAAREKVTLTILDVSTECVNDVKVHETLISGTLWLLFTLRYFYSMLYSGPTSGLLASH